jgi:hypothetical protein
LSYAKLDYRTRQHHARLRLRVESMPRKLVCQECGGMGGWTEVVNPEIGGPWFECGYCEGLGYVTPWMRGQWLRLRLRQEGNR